MSLSTDLVMPGTDSGELPEIVCMPSVTCNIMVVFWWQLALLGVG